MKITPEAIDWPALPVVCTILFSRIEALPSARSTLIDSTEIGIDAATVSPARKPTYTVTRPKMTPKIQPSKIARTVNSGTTASSATYGRKVVTVRSAKVCLQGRLPLNRCSNRKPSVPAHPQIKQPHPPCTHSGQTGCPILAKLDKTFVRSRNGCPLVDA